MRTSILATALALATFTNVAHADATLRYERTGTCDTDFDRLSISGSRLRSDSTVLGLRMSAIYDGTEQLLWALDHETRTYTPMEMDDDAQDFQGDVAGALGTRVKKEMAKVDEQLAAQGLDMQKMMEMQQQAVARMDPKQLEQMGIDPEQMQQQMEAANAAMKNLGGMGATRVTRATGETRRVAGHDCAVVETRVDDALVESTCEIQPDALPLGERDAKGFGRGIARLQKMGDTWAPLARNASGYVDESPSKGIAVEKVCWSPEGEESGRATLVFEEGGVAADAFDLPDGYRPSDPFGRDEQP